MKTLIALALLAVPVIAETPKEKPAPSENAAPDKADGSSFAKAIPAKSIPAEYDWLRKNHPGYKLRQQSLQMHQGKPYDVLAITKKDGKDIDVFFDISSFFGKEPK
ncbi:MAG: hypothetical protein RL088_2328 [Verrucomicrobiota bacterium]|jgi:hypothetical protein